MSFYKTLIFLFSSQKWRVKDISRSVSLLTIDTRNKNQPIALYSIHCCTKIRESEK